MTNPIIVKLLSSLLNDNVSVNGKTSGKINPFKSGKGDRQFFSDILRDLHASKNSMPHVSDKAAQIKTTSDRKGYKYYLDSFKKELLAQGKPLNKTFLREKDLPLVKTFLFKCGFSQEKVEKFVKDLKAENPNGEFNLSQLFLKINELGAPGRKDNQNETIAPATVPYVESVLRDFDLTPKELDNVFTHARMEDGGLDLNKLVEKLKEIKNRRSSADKAGAHQKLSRNLLAKLEKIGMDIPKKGKDDQISLDDFITSLEQIAEKSGKEKKVSPDIKNTIGKILEKVESSEQKSKISSNVKASGNYHFTESLLKEEINRKKHHEFNHKAISSIDKSKSRKNKSLSSRINQKDINVQNYVESNADTSNHTGKTDLVSKMNKQLEPINLVEEKIYRTEINTSQNNLPSNTEAFNLTNTLKTAEHGEKIFRGYIPGSVVGQVGKQISRSILRGDQIVTLQLKPPELGTVKIEMEIKDHVLRIGMIADNHSVKELLLNNIHELKDALIQHGVKLEKVDVQINYNFGQSLNGSKDGTDNGRSWGQNFNGEGFLADTHAEGSQERSVNILSGNNLLDLVA